MNSEESRQVLDRVISLFSWQISEDQRDAWLQFLSKTNTSLRSAFSAAQTMFEEESQWPRIATFRKALATVQRTSHSEEPVADPTPIGWIICQTNDINRGLIGWYLPVIVPGRQPHEDRIHSICEHHAQRHTKAFGGRWIFCIGWTVAQVCHQAQKYKAEAGIVSPAPSMGMLKTLRKLEEKLELAKETQP